MSGMLPGYAAMSADERAALAQSVQDEIGPGLQAYVEGDEQLYPQSVHVGLGRKP